MDRCVKLNRICLLLVFAISGYSSEAQLCNGSLGDPVVNIDFGTGGNVNNSGYTPTNAYTYTSSTCPDDGYYTITRSTVGCFGASWHTVSSDHTGGGAFMLVNASYTPGDFFLTTVSDLCPNTTYEFAAWLLNVLNRSGIRPNITFSIESPNGTVLQQYQTGDIPETFSAQWKQYGFFFTTPVNNATIVLRMTNNAPGGIGNDIALDDITFRPCGEKISAAINGYQDTVNICEGSSETFSFSGDASSAYQNPVYFWQSSLDTGKTWQDIPGANGLSYLRLPVSKPGSYWYRLTVVDASVQGLVTCRIASNFLVVNVHAKPVVEAGPERVYIKGHPVTLQAAVTGESPVYTWSPATWMSDVQVLDPEVFPETDIRYTLSAVSAFGCENSDTVWVKYMGGIFVPNAFTPNGDGRNDRWRIPALDISFESEVTVYNRWGQLVYRSEGSQAAWDGTLNGQAQASGTYVYYVHFRNKSFADMKGTLVLIR